MFRLKKLWARVKRDRAAAAAAAPAARVTGKPGSAAAATAAAAAAANAGAAAAAAQSATAAGATSSAAAATSKSLRSYYGSRRAAAAVHHAPDLTIPSSAMKRRGAKADAQSQSDASGVHSFGGSSGGGVPALIAPHYRQMTESYATNLLYGHVISRSWAQFGRQKREADQIRKMTRETMGMLGYPKGSLATPLTAKEREHLRLLMTADGGKNYAPPTPNASKP